MPTARAKNQARDRRKAKAREEAQIRLRATLVIQYFARLWCFQNATGYMNRFKYNIIDRLLSRTDVSAIKSITNWFKGGGYIVFYVGGMCEGRPISTSMVKKEFYHRLGHFVLTVTGSLYKLENHADPSFSPRIDKLSDMDSFLVTERDHYPR